jgi:AcrR family transcriptional regulator
VNQDFATAVATGDRRVRRSRASLMRAAVTMVSDRGTTAVAVSDLAGAADVSRQVLYSQFGDRDTLLFEAALDLVRRELLPGIARDTHAPGGRTRVLTATRHFAAYRAFYRAMFTGPRAYDLNKALSALLGSFNRQLADRMSARPLPPSTAEDLTTFVTGGWAAILSAWVIDGEDPLDPEEMADRLLRLASTLIGARPPKS